MNRTVSSPPPSSFAFLCHRTKSKKSSRDTTSLFLLEFYPAKRHDRLGGISHETKLFASFLSHRPSPLPFTSQRPSPLHLLVASSTRMARHKSSPSPPQQQQMHQLDKYPPAPSTDDHSHNQYNDGGRRDEEHDHPDDEEDLLDEDLGSLIEWKKVFSWKTWLKVKYIREWLNLSAFGGGGGTCVSFLRGTSLVISGLGSRCELHLSGGAQDWFWKSGKGGR